MKTVNAAVSTAIRSSNDVMAIPRLIADWNMNRYIDTVITNNPSEDTAGNDIEMFPITSIIGHLRPTKGINKARINQSTISDYSDKNRPRFYISSIEDKYKYWQSPYVSDAAGNISGVVPSIVYASNIAVNKVLLKLENSWASPITWTVDLTNDGTNWYTVATNPTIAADGVVKVYYNGTSWSSTRPADITPMASIRGVRINVTKLGPGQRGDGATTTYMTNNVKYNTTGGNSYFSLIEMGLHKEVDLSGYLINVSDNFDTSDVSQLYPIGSLTTNTASITLWNGENLFSIENPTSPYKDLMEANVEMNLEYIYTVAGTQYPVQQFKMYTSEWQGQKDTTTTVELHDFSSYFTEITPSPTLYENLTLPDIVYRLCDQVGYIGYQIVSHPNVVDYKIPVYYTTGEKNLWEEFDDLAKATQSAIFFDCYGVLKIKTRDAAFDPARAPDWYVRATTVNTDLPDLIEFNQTEQFENNVIKVKYQTSGWSDWNGGFPAMATVWEPDGTLVARACPLQAPLGATDAQQWLKVRPNDASYWPYTSMVNIEGELIRYNGKRFYYFTGALSNVINNTVVYNDADYRKYNEMTNSGSRWKNYFDGNLLVTTGRGQWNSGIVSHNIDITGWSCHGYVAANYAANRAGMRHNKLDSTLTLYPSVYMKKVSDVTVVSHGSINDAPFILYGAKFRFDSAEANTHQRAGIVLNNTGSGEAGYFIELTPSSKLGATQRKIRNELIVYTRNAGIDTLVGGRGTALNIANDVDYEMDIKITSGHQINVYINGLAVFSQTIATPQRQTQMGRFGFFIRGKSQITAEYVYAISRPTADIPDDFSFFDKVKGGYVGNLFKREWVYSWRTATRRVKGKTTQYQQKWNQQFMDEFGPIIHEVREFDVKFDPKPVLHSRLFSTNDWNAACIEYYSNPFGAKFVIANTGRSDAVINGSDTLSFAGTNRSVDQYTQVVGRALVLQDEMTIEVRNEAQIRARGEIEATLESPWIQSKEAAQALANWMKQHWSSGIDGAEVTIFGNPLIEVGDLIAVTYPAKYMTDIKYFVTGVQNTFDTGVETTLVLRRVSPPVV